MQDLRLYKASGNYVDGAKNSEIMAKVRPDDATANSIEVIAGKVVKFLLTARGSDAFNPNYGGTALHHKQISPSFLVQLRMELQTDLGKCYTFIKQTESVEDELLAEIKLVDFRYDPQLTPDRVDVYLGIRTTLNKYAVVVINNRTDS